MADRFARTRAALRTFDAQEQHRETEWYRCETDADVKACQQRDASALALVRAAFFEDTKDVNSADHQASLAFMRRMSELPPDLDAANESVPEPDYPSRGDDVEGAECLTQGFHYARRY